MLARSRAACGAAGMADMFIFDSPRDAELEAKYARSAAKRRRLEESRKRTKVSGKMAVVHERACMARFSEPVFCSSSSLLPFLPPAGAAYASSSVTVVEDAADDDMLDPDDCARSCKTTATLPLRSRHPRPESEEITIEEESRRQRLALPGYGPDSLPLFAVPPTSVHAGRLSQKCSCESLRAHADGNITTDFGNELLGQDESLFDLDDLDDDYDYTLLSDTVHTAWSVDDPRHTRDVSEFADELTAAEGGNTAPPGLRAAVDGRKGDSVVRRRDVSAGTDWQGLRWDSAHSTEARDHAISMRAFMHSSNLGKAWSDSEVDALVNARTSAERYYRFRHFNGLGQVRPSFSHYELRHMLASAGRRVYYANNSKIMQSDLAVPSEGQVAHDLTKSSLTTLPIKITSLHASSSHAGNVLIAGGFEGEYAMMKLDSEDPHTEGFVTHDRNGLVTHIHSFAHKTSGSLQAGFCSNDNRFRVMDVSSQRFTSSFDYDTSINCAVTAPDGRLRALVGDSADALITDAATGEELVSLAGHDDNIFACAWSPDQRFVATGSADGKVLLWEPRNWSRPLACMPSVVTCARSLHFTADSASLIAAENEDVVSIFDTRDWTGRQDIRFFGTIAGVALLDGGDELVIGNGDRTVGGLMTFQRTRGGHFDTCGSDPWDTKARRKRRNARNMTRYGLNEMVTDLIV